MWSVLTVLQTLPFWQSLKPFWPHGELLQSFHISEDGYHSVATAIGSLDAGADDNLAWAAQAVTGGAIWTFGLFFFGECGGDRMVGLCRDHAAPVEAENDRDPQMHAAGAGGNFLREDSPMLLKAYIACDIVVALTVRQPAGFAVFRWLMQTSRRSIRLLSVQAGVLIYMRRIQERMDKGGLRHDSGWRTAFP